MENISYVGLSQQVALQREMEVTANNIANMDTPGYKTQSVLFLEYINGKGGDKHEKLKQVEDYGMYRDLAPGTLKQTFNKLDVAIQGDGYFAVETPGGTRYTRDGGFALNANREVVTHAGYKVLGDGGPLVIQADANDITITGQGEIVTDKGTIGKIKVASFANPQKLKSVGENLLDAGAEQEVPADNARVEQGMLESSNVNPILQMNKMMQISRAYEAAQRMLIDDHQRILGAIDKLTRTG